NEAGSVFSFTSDGEVQVVTGPVVMVFIVSGIPIPPITIRDNQQLLGYPHNANHPYTTPLPANHPVRAECATLLEGIALGADDSISATIIVPSGFPITIIVPGKGGVSL